MKKPCEGDPVLNPEIASSGLSGKRGGTYGCTRVDSNTSCEGRAGEKNHDGLDIKADINSNLFNMYAGAVTDIRNSFSPGQYKYISLGNFVVVRSVINGVTYNIKYNHLNSVSVFVGSTVNVHQNNIITGTTDYGFNQIRPHIKMFSPLDLHTFLFMVLNAKNNSQINIKDVFSTMVASNGVYTLKFIGNNQTFINTAFNPYSEDLKNDFIKLIDRYGLEGGFLKFLESLNLNNIVALFKAKNNGVVEEIKLTENGKKRRLPCE